MGIIYNQQSDRTELQKRLAQELSEKAKNKKLDPTGDRPDGVEDSAYIKDTKQTTSLAWVWVLIVVVVVAVMIWFFVASGNTV
jgi:Flp pilus assembly protein TadB